MRRWVNTAFTKFHYATVTQKKEWEKVTAFVVLYYTDITRSFDRASFMIYIRCHLASYLSDLLSSSSLGCHDGGERGERQKKLGCSPVDTFTS